MKKQSNNNQKKKDFTALLETKTPKQVLGYYLFQATKNAKNDVLTSDLSGVAFRQYFQTSKYDYTHEFIEAKINAGSIMEYLIATQLYGRKSHKVDKKEGYDFKRINEKQKVESVEIKVFSQDSHPNGYTMEDWTKHFNGKDKFLCFAIETTVYEINGLDLVALLEQLKFKKVNRGSKTIYKITAINHNLNLLIENAVKIGKVDLIK